MKAKKFGEEELTNKLKGYIHLTNAMMNLIDLYQFLKRENRFKEAKIARLSLEALFDIDETE